MNCHFFQRHLSEYLQKQLTPPQTRQYEVHLEQCACCRADLVAVQKVWSHLQTPAQVKSSYALQLKLDRLTATTPLPGKGNRPRQRQMWPWLIGLSILGGFIGISCTRSGVMQLVQDEIFWILIGLLQFFWCTCVLLLLRFKRDKDLLSLNPL